MSKEPQEPQTTRRGFIKRARNTTLGAIIGGASGVVLIDSDDTPKEENVKAGGGALTGAAIGFMAGKKASKPKEPEPEMTRRGFMQHAGRRVGTMMAGTAIGTGIGVATADKNDPPDEQKKHVVGGAIAGAALAVAVDAAAHRDPQATYRQSEGEFRKKREWRAWQDRANKRYDGYNDKDKPPER